MNTKILAAAAGIAWAAAFVASAAPAGAFAITTQPYASYASCSSSSTPALALHWECNEDGEQIYPGIYTNYLQTIKMIGTACNSGGCSQNLQVYVNTVYSAGRKQVTSAYALCMNYGNKYELGGCAC